MEGALNISSNNLAEHLQLQIPNGKMSDEKLMRTLSLSDSAKQSGQQLYWSSHNLSQEMVHADKQMLFRTLENAVTNALRHAKTKVSLGFSYTDQVFTVRVEDDGSGFSVKALLS